MSQNFHYHYISLLLLFHWQVPCIELTCDISVVGLGRGTQLQVQKDRWTWTHTPSTCPPPWLVLTCKHFWNFPGCWARTGPVSEELCWDFCLLGDSETLRIGDHPVKGEKSLKILCSLLEKIAFFSDTSSRRNNRFHFTHFFHITVFLLLWFPQGGQCWRAFVLFLGRTELQSY